MRLKAPLKTIKCDSNKSIGSDKMFLGGAKDSYLDSASTLTHYHSWSLIQATNSQAWCLTHLINILKLFDESFDKAFPFRMILGDPRFYIGCGCGPLWNDWFSWKNIRSTATLVPSWYYIGYFESLILIEHWKKILYQFFWSLN